MRRGRVEFQLQSELAPTNRSGMRCTVVLQPLPTSPLVKEEERHQTELWGWGSGPMLASRTVTMTRSLIIDHESLGRQALVNMLSEYCPDIEVVAQRLGCRSTRGDHPPCTRSPLPRYRDARREWLRSVEPHSPRLSHLCRSSSSQPTITMRFRRSGQAPSTSWSSRSMSMTCFAPSNARRSFVASRVDRPKRITAGSIRCSIRCRRLRDVLAVLRSRRKGAPSWPARRGDRAMRG